ncbi:MAG: hypothetical protein M3450_05980, partial [Actinomycetota bacterium]|nr:hypothetical protein [Actinomycetota bacterium]
AVEPPIHRAIEKLAHEVDARAADRLAETLRRVFGRVLKELADLDNPMRTPVGHEPGDGALFEPAPLERTTASANGSTGPENPPEVPELPELEDSAADAPTDLARSEARPDRRRTTDLPSVSPDPDPGEARSRFEPETGIVYYNDRHEDYLVVRDDEAGLLDYLATLVAKEYVLYNNPRAASGDFAEEMVRMLVRVRRHLPKRR